MYDCLFIRIDTNNPNKPKTQSTTSLHFFSIEIIRINSNAVVVYKSDDDNNNFQNIFFFSFPWVSFI